MPADSQMPSQKRESAIISLHTLPFDVMMRIISFLMPQRDATNPPSHNWTFLLVRNVLSLACISQSACEAVLTTLKFANLDKFDIDFFKTNTQTHSTDNTLLSAAAAACQVLSKPHPTHLRLLAPNSMLHYHSPSCSRYTAWHLLGAGNTPDLALGEIIGRFRTTKSCLAVAEARLLTRAPLKWLALGSFKQFPPQVVYTVLNKLLRTVGSTITEIWLFGSGEAVHNAILDTFDSLPNLKHLRIATDGVTKESQGDPKMFLLRLLFQHHHANTSLSTIIAADRQFLRFGQVEKVSSKGIVLQFTGARFTAFPYLEGREVRHMEFSFQHLHLDVLECFEQAALLPNLETVSISCEELHTPKQWIHSSRSNFFGKITKVQISKRIFPSAIETPVYTVKDTDLLYLRQNCLHIRSFKACYDLAAVPSLGSFVAELPHLVELEMWDSDPVDGGLSHELSHLEVEASTKILEDLLKSNSPLQRLSIARICITADMYIEVLKRFGATLRYIHLPLTSSITHLSDEFVDTKYSDHDAAKVLRAIPKFCKMLEDFNIGWGVLYKSENLTENLTQEAMEVQEAMKKHGISRIRICL